MVVTWDDEDMRTLLKHVCISSFDHRQMPSHTHYWGCIKVLQAILSRSRSFCQL